MNKCRFQLNALISDFSATDKSESFPRLKVPKVNADLDERPNSHQMNLDLDESESFKSKLKDAEQSYRKSEVSCKNDDVDIAFLVDCTRSMRKHVLRTKANIGSIVKNIRKTFKNKVRLAFVAYRDLHCPNNIQDMKFTRRIKEFTSFADENC